ncbi:hypothetical protein CY652_13990 [Burkholderia sp. WAC0059]|uniref:AvrD family protein n=1 Tax=Burkholderia sp. WAC0059 TaxID=2066022 RepID=UPI000C7EC816|nr:AvrD family protein [Burkholderia sp. WAC0059]PLZ01781.1 hypothetical protein CY652_13990 [Burkholderia sp. WAC0059]
MSELVNASIEDFLGPSANRFFGSGFKRVDYEWEETSASPQGTGRLVRLRYPDDWSRKETQTKLPPHLSTIDALLIAVSMAERILSLSNLSIEHFWISGVSIKAGQKPIENLDSVIAVMHFENTCDSTHRFGADIGSMRISFALENNFHLKNRTKFHEAVDQTNSYYLECTKIRNQVITDIQLPAPGIADSILSVHPLRSARAGGIESAYGTHLAGHAWMTAMYVASLDIPVDEQETSWDNLAKKNGEGR